MIDTADDPSLMQAIPVPGFVREHDRLARDDLCGDIDALGFVHGHERARAALALADGDDDAALARLVFRQAAVNAIFGSTFMRVASL